MLKQQMGWDIGGAHVKAVLLNSEGQLLYVRQVACPLWLGLDKLEIAIQAIVKDFHLHASQVKHAVTMTGELADLFADRHDGVMQISQCVIALLGTEVLFYRMHHTNADAFVPFTQVSENSKAIASANWHASACLLAKYLPSALLIDIGSTTTDIVQIEDGNVVNCAMTDAKRMQQDRLVYTGIVRTPLMAVAQKLTVAGKETNVAAEHFATMADVYRLTEELPEALDMTETADGGPKTTLASARRLARMVGYDVEDKPLEVWQQLAQSCRDKQLNQIALAVLKHLKSGAMIVGTGAGEFLVAALSAKLNCPYTRFTSLLSHELDQNLDVCLPAYAVAKLAYDRSITS
jgi:probable H4MPT-linked C1 transfer pathway protein